MPRKGKNGNIYSTPRKAVFCNRCKEPCGMYPTGKAGIPKLVCSTCKVKRKDSHKNTVTFVAPTGVLNGIPGKECTYADLVI